MRADARPYPFTPQAFRRCAPLYTPPGAASRGPCAALATGALHCPRMDRMSMSRDEHLPTPSAHDATPADVTPAEVQPTDDDTDDGAPLGLDQAARYAGRSPATLRRAVRQGKLPRRYRQSVYGPALVFSRADLDAWLADMARTVEQANATATEQEQGQGSGEPSGEPSQALTPAPAVRLYALVATAYARRLAALEETSQQQAGHLAEAHEQLAALAERIAALEEASRQQAQPQAGAAPLAGDPGPEAPPHAPTLHSGADVADVGAEIAPPRPGPSFFARLFRRGQQRRPE